MKKVLLITALVSSLSMADEKNLKLKIRLQPRIDFGEIMKEGDNYVNRSDFYIRRARLEVTKKFKNVPIGKELKLNITLRMDKGERDYDYKKAKKDPGPFKTALHYAYADWKIGKAFSIRIGKSKKPFSRISLTSSSRQLLIERPVSTETAKKWTGDYYGNHIMLHGKFIEGTIRYMLSISDGSTIESVNKTGGDTITSHVNLGNFYAVRIELSPPGMVEKKKDDTGIGEKNKGNVLSLGASFARNTNFSVDSLNNETATVLGVDLFSRFYIGKGAFVVQAEYVDMSYKRLGRTEKGWYVQGGYAIDTDNIGIMEPALRYERIDYGTRNKDIVTIGFNHYIKMHRFKWAYNFVIIGEEEGGKRNVHQLQAQIYF